MAAGTWTQFDNFIYQKDQGKINLATDTFVMVLLTAAWTPSTTSNATWTDISANEVATGGGYTQGGVVLTETLTSVAGGDQWTASPTSWTNFTASARYAVIVHRAGTTLATTDILVAYSDLDTSLAAGTNLVGSGGTLTITESGSGIIDDSHTP